MAPIKAMLKETSPNVQIQHLVKAIKRFRTTFLEKTSVKGKCILPETLVRLFGPAWDGYGNIEIRCCETPLLSEGPYECIFEKPDGSWARRNLYNIVTLEDYEQFVFSLWSYTDGQALDVGGEDKNCMINWVVKLEAVPALERMVRDIDRILLPLSRINSRKKCIKKIYKILGNGNQKWMLYRIRWTYIKELDEAIRELRMECEHNSVDTGQKEISDKPIQTIPYEYRTSPMSQTKLAEFWGEDMTQRKIRQMIDTGHLNTNQLGRQKFIFDMRQLPLHVKSRLTELN